MSNEKDTDLYGLTAREWLRRWDNGDSVWSLEMGGLGTGYEQCIQVATAEVVREMLDTPIPVEGDVPGWKAYWAKADVALHRAAKWPGMGMSGGQAGAAKSLAVQLLKRGPAGFFAWIDAEEPSRKHDKIQVCRQWPNPPAAVSEPA